MPRISMAPADREKYGGEEWYELEMADLLDEETGVLEQVEEQWGMSPFEFLGAVSRGTVKGIRALIWAARWKQGLRDNAATFRPRTQDFSGVRIKPTEKEEARAKAREGDPPAERAEETPKPALRDARKSSPKKTTARSKGS